jgi:hypothetical protein
MKKEKFNVANEATAETAAEATPTAVAETPKTETIEDVEKRLNIELARLNHKKKLASHREKFINSMGDLQLYIDALKTETEFETQSGRITFSLLATDNYNRANYTDKFSISNTDLIQKFCKMLFSEMENKKSALETELLTA